MELEEYQKKMNRYYDSEHKLLQYPTKKPMRVIALKEIAGLFEVEKKYTEKEVNQIIKSAIAFTDIEMIRRELFQFRFMNRLKDGSEYWLNPDWNEITFME